MDPIITFCFFFEKSIFVECAKLDREITNNISQNKQNNAET